jgi:hypothetical protein
MCAPFFAFWVGRHNNGPINEHSGIRGGNVNTRVVKLQPLKKDIPNGGNEGLGQKVEEDGRLQVSERPDQRYAIPPQDRSSTSKASLTWNS